MKSQQNIKRRIIESGIFKTELFEDEPIPIGIAAFTPQKALSSKSLVPGINVKKLQKLVDDLTKLMRKQGRKGLWNQEITKGLMDEIDEDLKRFEDEYRSLFSKFYLDVNEEDLNRLKRKAAKHIGERIIEEATHHFEESKASDLYTPLAAIFQQHLSLKDRDAHYYAAHFWKGFNKETASLDTIYSRIRKGVQRASEKSPGRS